MRCSLTSCKEVIQPELLKQIPFNVPVIGDISVEWYTQYVTTVKRA